ncbi:non-membrane spanning protein tyrosine kinase [Balamuthia mandrillaris]
MMLHLRLVLMSLLVGAAFATFVFHSNSPTNPTPGLSTVLSFKFDVHQINGGCRFEFRYSKPAVAEKYTSKSNYWTCDDYSCKYGDIWGICGVTSNGVIVCHITNTFSFTVNIPPDAILQKQTGQGRLICYELGSWETVSSVTSRTAEFWTGDAVVSLNSTIDPQQTRYVAGAPARMDVRIGNLGPSAARMAACDVVVSRGEFVVPPSNCQTTAESNRWRCTGAFDIFPGSEVEVLTRQIEAITDFVIQPAPEHRDTIWMKVTNCTSSGTVTSEVSDVFHNFTVVAVWNLTQSFSESTDRTLRTNSVSRISALIHNDGPSASLASICRWTFSTSALNFEEALSADARECTASYEPNLVVSCMVDAAPGNTTVSISVSAQPQLAGTPSFEVLFDCVDEAGAVVGGSIPMSLVDFIEDLDDVTASVSFVNWSFDEEKESSDFFDDGSSYGFDSSQDARSKRELDDLGTTEDGAIIFDEAIALILEANSEGALYTRDVTCDVIMEGGDAPLVSSKGSESTCIDQGVQTTGSALPARLIECRFPELRGEVSSAIQTILSIDRRVKQLNITVECRSSSPNTIDNPVYHHSYRFIHAQLKATTPRYKHTTVSEVDEQSTGSDSSAQRGENSSEDFLSKWMWVFVGAGGGLLLLLVAAPTLICLLLRKRRASLKRKRHTVEHLEALDDGLEMYATPINFSKSARRQSVEKRGFKWEIPFVELEFEEQIGRGAFGVVWRGKWRATPVAIKMDSPALKEAFKAEMDIMKNLRPHSNVVQLFGVCTEDGQPWCLVTEYLAKGDLRHYLRNNGKQDYSTIIRMGVQIATGMHHLHSEGIIHRDLAARNVLLTPDLSVKVGGGYPSIFLADFGLSSMSKAVDASSKVPVKWTAPEALSGNASEKSDVWSNVSLAFRSYYFHDCAHCVTDIGYGVLIWEMVNAGEAPYSGLSHQEVVKSLNNGEVLTLDVSAPQILHDVLEACFQIDPRLRPSFHDIIKMLQV